MKRRGQKAIERDLFGAPVRRPLPRRKVVERPDGRGFDIAVRQGNSAAYHRLNLQFATKGAAWQALRAGVGQDGKPVELAVTVTVLRLRNRQG